MYDFNNNNAYREYMLIFHLNYIFMFIEGKNWLDSDFRSRIDYEAQSLLFRL
jgi:hypothetical protein